MRYFDPTTGDPQQSILNYARGMPRDPSDNKFIHPSVAVLRDIEDHAALLPDEKLSDIITVIIRKKSY